ncbi:hypothetical protein CRUP_015235 [Coryphaenoides rupestris]|nr:hypothetical protein CRUP_015235 [Coryphaenoides rupestris]
MGSRICSIYGLTLTLILACPLLTRDHRVTNLFQLYDIRTGSSSSTVDNLDRVIISQFRLLQDCPLTSLVVVVEVEEEEEGWGCDSFTLSITGTRSGRRAPGEECYAHGQVSLRVSCPPPHKALWWCPIIHDVLFPPTVRVQDRTGLGWTRQACFLCRCRVGDRWWLSDLTVGGRGQGSVVRAVGGPGMAPAAQGADQPVSMTDPLLLLLLLLLLIRSQGGSGVTTHGSKVWGEVPLPEDLETGRSVHHASDMIDDEDFAADDASGDLPSGQEFGSTPWQPEGPDTTIYYRALVNFTNSLVYGPELDDIYSTGFTEISDAVVDTLESEKVIREDGADVFVELDVGSEYNSNDEQIRSMLYSVVKEGSIASYLPRTSGLACRMSTGVAMARASLLEYRCDNRPDCRDMSDEMTVDCRPLRRSPPSPPPRPPAPPAASTKAAITTVKKPVGTPGLAGPCRVDQAKCQSGECIPRDYLCDGEMDCTDGSDEFRCECAQFECISPGPPAPPSVTSPPKESVSVARGETVTFTCQAVGVPTPIISWRLNWGHIHASGRWGFLAETHTHHHHLQHHYHRHHHPPPPPPTTTNPHPTTTTQHHHPPSNATPPNHHPPPSNTTTNHHQLHHTTTTSNATTNTTTTSNTTTNTHTPHHTTATTTTTTTNTTTTSNTTTNTTTTSNATTNTITTSNTTTTTHHHHLQHHHPPPTPPTTTNITKQGRRREGVFGGREGKIWGPGTPHQKKGAGQVSMTSKNGHGTLVIRDVKEADQGAYTCEAINAKGLVFGIPDGVLTLQGGSGSNNCADGHFSVEGRSCVSCFCAGITKTCQATGRYRNRITLRFNEEDNHRGVNVTYQLRPGNPPLSSTQLLINPEMEEFQLVDLSRRFLNLDSYWTLPRQFLGNKIDSYGGSLKYKIRYTLARGLSEPEEKPDVILVGNGRRLVYRRGNPTPARIANQKEIKFTEELLMTLAGLDSINIRTVYDNHMVSVALSDIIMDTTSVECPAGYTGLSCEVCSAGFERIPGGSYLGTCAGCNCNGHASACDSISGNCLSCQHNTEGPQCDKFSATCYLDTDQQATCNACQPGYAGRRCEKCAAGYQGNPLQPNGRCILAQSSRCDSRGSVSSNSRPCSCKNNVAGAQCDQCKPGSFHLTEGNADGCIQCFCMGVTKQCGSSSWSRDQVRGGTNGQLFSLTNLAQTRGTSDGLTQTGAGGSSQVVYRSFATLPSDTYYWVLPESFLGDKVTAYGGELSYTVRYEPRQRSLVIDGQPDVVIQGNGISLEHHSQTRVSPRTPTTCGADLQGGVLRWRRTDSQPCTREHLLMALADITGLHDPSHLRRQHGREQECDAGYTRTGSGLYLGTCERCDCNGHASSCDPETGACLQCLHNTGGPRFSQSCYLDSDGQPTCESCPPGYTGRRCERLPGGHGGGGQQLDPLARVVVWEWGVGQRVVVLGCWQVEGGRVVGLRRLVVHSGRRWELQNNHRHPFLKFRRHKAAICDPFQQGELEGFLPVTAARVTASRVPAVYTRWAPRLPPRVTVSPEERHASFQQLLRLHLNRFNHRLSMLESNTLDMKDSIQTMIEQQGQLGAQLEKLVTMRLAAPERQEKVGELEKSYGDMETRLSRLEGRLEILIDGFTALAQEMNKMKRSRHSSRSVQERRAPPLLVIGTAAPLGRTPTPTPTTKRVFVVVTVTGRPMTRIATVPQSIPTPRVPVHRLPTASPDQKRRPTTTTSTTTSTTTTSTTTSSSTPTTTTSTSTTTSTTTSKPIRHTVRKVVTRSQAITKPTTKSKSKQGRLAIPIRIIPDD